MSLFGPLHRVWMVWLLAALLWVPPAAAYLDPGTGAAVLQWLAATFLGGLFALKVFWKRITAKFAFRSVDKQDSGAVDGDE